MENSQWRKFLACLRHCGRYWPVSSTPEAGHFVCHILIAQFRFMFTLWVFVHSLRSIRRVFLM